MIGPDESQRAHASEQVNPTPPGHFLSDQLEDVKASRRDLAALVT